MIKYTRRISTAKSKTKPIMSNDRLMVFLVICRWYNFFKKLTILSQVKEHALYFQYCLFYFQLLVFIQVYRTDYCCCHRDQAKKNTHRQRVYVKKLFAIEVKKINYIICVIYIF